MPKKKQATSPLAKFFNSCLLFRQNHPALLLVIFFVLTWLISTYIFYLRFPNNFIFPNFFAEDGQHFVSNIADKGFFSALLTTFNGYFIFGIYILSGIGFVANDILFHGEFINLPTSLALVSYAFLGLCATLPLLLLRRWISLPYRLAMALLITLLPMPSFDYGTIGTIGNLKFAFNYIAVLLVLYRSLLPRNAKRIFIVDFCLAICAFTTAGVYFILPFIILSDGLQIYKKSVRSSLSKLFTRDNLSLWSGVVLALIALAQVIFIAINGVPKFPGYLDEPYKAANTIEVFVARSYLYPAISTIYHHLSDIVVLLIFGATCFVGYKYSRKRNIPVYILGLVSILTTSLVFVINRTGTVYYYDHYKTSGFDNFFYAQNFIAIVLIIFLLSDMTKKIGWFRTLYIPLMTVMLLATCSIRTNATYAPNDFMQYQIGTIQEQIKPQCDGSEQTITFSVYPFKFLTMSEPRERMCTPSVESNPIHLSNIFLADNGKDVENINPKYQVFTQTFDVAEDGLNGLGIYLGTYYQPVLDNYSLKIMDKECKAILREVAMPHYVRDNAYRTITFEPIDRSKDKTFCFKIEATTKDAQPIALRLSGKDIYKRGLLSIQGEAVDRDVTFSLLYK